MRQQPPKMYVLFAGIWIFYKIAMSSNSDTSCDVRTTAQLAKLKVVELKLRKIIPLNTGS